MLLDLSAGPETKTRSLTESVTADRLLAVLTELALDLRCAQQPDAPDNHILYSAKVPADRTASDYTPRVIPCGLKASVRLEAPHMLWRH